MSRCFKGRSCNCYALIYQNVCNLDRGEELEEYKSKKVPVLISLGKYRGILSRGEFVMGGFIPALMKSFVEKWEMWKKRRVG